MTRADRELLEYLCEIYGTDIIEEKFTDNMKKKYAPIIVACLLGAGGIGGIHTVANNNRAGTELTAQKDTVVTPKPLEEQIPNFDKTVQEVKDYITYAVGCIGKTYEDVDIHPETLVKLCYTYDYDLPMLLSALHQESHFGTTPRAKRTNSPCSVGCWDDGQNRITYKSQDDAVEHYIKIMKNNFIRDREIEDVLTDGNLVNGAGNRYASDKDYEKKLRRLRNKIMKKFPNLSQI